MREVIVGPTAAVGLETVYVTCFFEYGITQLYITQLAKVYIYSYISSFGWFRPFLFIFKNAFRQLPLEVERCRFSEMDLGLGGPDLGMAEWLHFMLLRASAPSHVAAKHLNRHLRKALED